MNDAVLNYKTAMSVFKSWREAGLISEEELLAIDTITAEKYGLSLTSIYRETDLICSENRVIYGRRKGEANEKNC